MLTKGVCLLHDNAIPHTTNATEQLLDSFGWEVLNHPRISLVWHLQISISLLP